jgi:DNA-binding transcriptional MerR regulator
MLAQPIKEQKKKIKLSELSDLLKVKKSTIKQWEKDFNLQPTGSLYSEQEITLFKKIKQLLHQKGAPLETAKKEIEKEFEIFFTLATKTDSFQPAQSDSKTLKSEKIIEKETEEALIFQEKQTLNLEAIAESLQRDTIEFEPQTKEAMEKTTISVEKEPLQQKATSSKICLIAEKTSNPAFHTTLQTIKSITLAIKEKLQK